MYSFLDYATQMLHAISQWLMAEPMIWIFSLVFLAWIINLFFDFFRRL